ncbi:MAG: hypoxanthine phosphoribosyltransferase [Bacteroidales bacterium]|jgi:hypoxanthine phosphoribosyltransferase|nr:hypoxanthine phosphoribosyltransferase [Bacteroidales bacterium]
MNKIIQVFDKKFELYIPHKEIIESINRIAEAINNEYKDDDPLFLGVLNGSFIFAAELYQRISIASNISFVKVSSYSGTKSTEHIKQLIGFDIPVENRRIIILEDIIDSGLTMKHVLNQLSGMRVKDVKIATLLFKPESFKENYNIDYIGKSIPNDFILGFGLDYDGYGRNYEDIYKII